MAVNLIEKGKVDAAIALLAIGAENATAVFKHLNAKEVQILSLQMHKTKGIKRERIEEVAKRIVAVADKQTGLGMNSDEYIRKVVQGALGEDKASFLLDRILQGSDTSGIEGLKWMDPATVAELIKAEHPQIISTILVHLERDFAAAVLNRLPDRMRSDIITRISTLDGVQPYALKELNDVLAKVIAGGEKLKKTSLGGTRVAAEILNFVGNSVEKSVLDEIREQDNELSTRIQEEMFTFENLLDVDDRGMQTILREIPADVLVTALKGSEDAIKEKVFKNMSSRASEGIKEDIEMRGPIRLTDVDSAKKEILKIVRRLADDGAIVIGGNGEDAFV